jgi:hypothetical protein
LDFFALTLALPDMARTFAVTPQSAQWALSGYMLSLGSLFIVAGRVGDIVGRRRAFLTGPRRGGGHHRGVPARGAQPGQRLRRHAADLHVGVAGLGGYRDGDPPLAGPARDNEAAVDGR